MVVPAIVVHSRIGDPARDPGSSLREARSQWRQHRLRQWSCGSDWCWTAKLHTCWTSGFSSWTFWTLCSRFLNFCQLFLFILWLKVLVHKIPKLSLVVFLFLYKQLIILVYMNIITQHLCLFVYGPVRTVQNQNTLAYSIQITSTWCRFTVPNSFKLSLFKNWSKSFFTFPS